MDARRRRGLFVALPLLVLQAVAGGAVALAHAGEAAPTGTAVEAGHDSSCPVVHNPLRCATCHFAAARLAAPRAAVVVPGCSARVAMPLAYRVPVVTNPEDFPAPPRAPPLVLS